MILFRGTGADALRYVEADRSRADDYYTRDGANIQYTVLDGSGNVTGACSLSNDEYHGWADWVSPDTGESMGRPRHAGADRLGSPRFAEMTINGPKSLSIAAALHPDVSDALDAAQQDALREIQRWLAQHSVTRVGPLGRQEVVPVERMQVVGISHRTSRAGDPHRHIHMQIGTRVWAAGRWRALDTGALFKQQGTIRALGTAILAAHPQLADALDQHGLTLDPVTGEVVELEPFNALMSKRGTQVRRNLERLEAEWEAAHPDETMGPVVASRLTAQAWAHERPAKKLTTLREEAAWLTELREAGYDPDRLARAPKPRIVSLDALSVEKIASRALDRCASEASTWTRHTVQEHAARLVTEYGVRTAPAGLAQFTELATRLALGDCFSVLPPGAPAPEHVAHLATVRVVEAETALRDLLTQQAPKTQVPHPSVEAHARALGLGLDGGQLDSAAAVASVDPLVIVEGAAGSGKTTMLLAATHAAEHAGRATRLVAPTRKAALVAAEKLGVAAESAAALAHAHGYRWNRDGVWTRLRPGDTDPETGNIYAEPPEAARLEVGTRLVVDEAGMLDQDTAIALLTICAESGASVALVGDRAQLAAVGRGGVLDAAAQVRGRIHDMAEVHRFTDPAYGALTVRMRDGDAPGDIYDELTALGLIQLHADADAARAAIAAEAAPDESVTVSSNEEAAKLNDLIRDRRVTAGLVDPKMTTMGSDGLSIGAGDLVQTRKNNTRIRVSNRQTWMVQQVEQDGSIWVQELENGRKHQASVHLPADYVAAHTHLAYAATAYGVQGITIARSRTLLTDSTTAAQVYVGMTRGEDQNVLHLIADDHADGRAQFVAAMERDRADRGLTHATGQAIQEVAGLIEDGPAKRVRSAVARLTRRAEEAEQRAARFAEYADEFDRMREQHQHELAAAASVAASASETAVELREYIRVPLRDAAVTDAQEMLALADALSRAELRARTAGPFARRNARKVHAETRRHHLAARDRLSHDWGETGVLHAGNGESWADAAAGRRTDADARVAQAETTAATARARVLAIEQEQRQAKQQLAAQAYCAEQVRRDPLRAEFNMPRRDATAWTQKAQRARAEVAKLTSMTPAEAGQYLDARAAAAKEAREARTRRIREAARTHESSDPQRSRPGRSL
ncbi:MobF family relaxase [Leucobacter soli]|uniref:MobF family relaxase n=1 Tax=Leucobacter soli TaxID=2812850 RepID=UPI00360F1EBF